MKSQKKALIVQSTDWHLKKENIDQIKDLVLQQCELALELEAEYLVCLGDIFDSRIAQREDVLSAFGDILDMIDSYGLKLWAIPGNHDKTVYSSIKSFLDPFKGRDYFKLVDKIARLPFIEEQIQLNFIPFFSDEVWLGHFDLLKTTPQLPVLKGCKEILLTHIAVTGSRNNDGTMISSSLSPGIFKDFFKVFSGHYHDQQKIGSNFYHIPSIQQNNFGENVDKGFTVLYADGSHELVKSKFKEFVKVQIDLDTINSDELLTLKKKYKGSESNVRFEFKGSENVLKSLKKEDFTSLGIDVKTKNKEIEDDIIFSESAEVVEHTGDSIIEEFKKCCEKENWNVEQGLKYLNKKLK